MCGICGFIYFDDRPVQEDIVRSMSDSQKHRGPDESGTHLEPHIALGHRRLSIIDLTSGQQPLSNEDGTIWIVLNGEIYNYQDLNTRLAANHTFRTRSDTETIVHLYESYPNDFVEQLRGMFAFALWDRARQTLLLARDRLGKKPLYYYVDEEKLVFGSELKSILRHPDLRLEADEQALSDYFSLGYIPAPKSIFRRIRKIRPGHFLRVKNGAVQELKYWDLALHEENGKTEQQWLDLLTAELRDAVKGRLMSEVPLGAFLSGGVDSSAVVALMSTLMDQPVKTATIGFSEDAFDESRYARQVSEHLHTDHYHKVVTPDTIRTIEKLSWHYDEPFADSSALPTFYVSQVAREKVTVALSGDGGDENFAGYRRYYFDLQENRLRKILPLSVRRMLFSPLALVYPKLDWAPRFLRAKSTFQSLAHDPVEGYFESASIFRKHDKPLLLSSDLKRQLSGYESSGVFRDHYDHAGTSDPLSRIQYLDIKCYLTDDILAKVDRASMANSLEVRCPLLDHKVVELAAKIPPALKLKGMIGKYIFKRAMEPFLPREIIYRKKMGFAVPLAEWFRNGIREYAAAEIIGREDPYLDSSFIRKIWEQHQSGVRDRSSQLWTVLMFRLWHKNFSRSTATRS